MSRGFFGKFNDTTDIDSEEQIAKRRNFIDRMSKKFEDKAAREEL